MKVTQEEIKNIDSLLEGLSIYGKEDYLLENNIEELRVCENCGKLIENGYVIFGCEQYCLNKCLQEMVEKGCLDNSIFEIIEKAQDDNVVSYWTAWN